MLSLGRREESLRESDRALSDLDPDGPRADSWAHLVRSWALHGLGRDVEALAGLDLALTLEDPANEVHAQRGWLLWECGRLDEAVDSFDRALTGSPDYPWALAGRGVTLLYKARHEDAVAVLTRAFVVQFGLPEGDAETELARPLAELLREHLPTQQMAITAGIRLVALLAWQKQWPNLTRQIATVLAHRPSPRLLAAALRLLRGASGALDAHPGRGDEKRIAWTRRLIAPIRLMLDREAMRGESA